MVFDGSLTPFSKKSIFKGQFAHTRHSVDLVPLPRAFTCLYFPMADIRVKLVDKHVHGIDLEAMDAELQILKEKEELRKERQKLEERQHTLSKKV